MSEACRCGWNGHGEHLCHRQCGRPGTKRLYSPRVVALAGMQDKAEVLDTVACDECWERFVKASMPQPPPPAWLEPLLETVQPDEPAPAPAEGKEDIYPIARRVFGMMAISAEARERWIRRLDRRTVFGANKYGTVLRTFNGRPFPKDGADESVDWCNYMVGDLMEGGDPDVWQEMLYVQQAALNAARKVVGR